MSNSPHAHYRSHIHSASNTHSGQTRYKARRGKKRQGILNRTRMRGMLWGATLIFAATCVSFAYRSPLFKVRHVNVIGLDRLMPQEAEQIKGAVSLAKSTNLFQVRSGKLEGALSRIPSVSSAVVHRRLPNKPPDHTI